VAGLVKPELPGPGQVWLRVEACGLGQRDWDVAMLDALPRTPLVPGLEGVGVVEEVGPGVTLAIGSRVAITPLAGSCGACRRCEQGWPAACSSVQLHGFHQDGALRAAGLFSAQHLVPIANGDAARLAVAAGSGWAALSAIERAHLEPGQRVGVWGIGGVGHLVTQQLKAQGYSVFADDLDADRRRLSLELGAQPFAPYLTVDAAIVCTPSPQAAQRAVRAVVRGGTVVLCAASPLTRLDLASLDLVGREVSVVGSFLGPSRLAVEAMRTLTPVTRVLTAADSIANLYALRDGGYRGRLVVTFE
jgi:alcohol dehydrogenase, propanol-preferring